MTAMRITRVAEHHFSDGTYAFILKTGRTYSYTHGTNDLLDPGWSVDDLTKAQAYDQLADDIQDDVMELDS